MCVSPVWGSPSAETRGNLPSVVVVTVSEDDGRALREEMASWKRDTGIVVEE